MKAKFKKKKNKENGVKNSKKMSGLTIFGFAVLALAVSGLVWFFVSIL